VYIAQFAVELLLQSVLLLLTAAAVCWEKEGPEEWQHKEKEYQVQETVIQSKEQDLWQ